VNEADPIGNDARRSERLRKLGRGPHICLFCGLADPECLIRVLSGWLVPRVPRSVLEKHHVFLRDLDPDSIVLLCVLCHFKVSRWYVKAGIDFGPEPDPRRRVALMLKALSVFLEILANVVWQWSELLLKGEGH
jgi:hypothetical protein